VFKNFDNFVIIKYVCTAVSLDDSDNEIIKTRRFSLSDFS